MRKSAERALNKELDIILASSDHGVIKESFDRLINLADILDSLGDEKDADRIDEIVKEAASLWDALFSGIGGAATTKDEAGTPLWKSVLQNMETGGDWGKFLNKDVLLPVITHAVMAGATGYMAGAIIDKIAEEFPKLAFMKDSTILRTLITGALTYAVTQSKFAEHLTDGIVQQTRKFLGWAAPKQEEQEAKPATPAPAATPAKPVAQQQPEGSDTQTFQVAAPGAKS